MPNKIVQTLAERLSKYGFADTLGHPLENCAEFQKLAVLANSGEEYLTREKEEAEASLADGSPDFQPYREANLEYLATVNAKLEIPIMLVSAYSAALAAQPDPRVTALVEATTELIKRVNEVGCSLNCHSAIEKARSAIYAITDVAAAKGEPAAERPWTRSEELLPPAGKLCHVRRGTGRLHDARYDRGLWIYEADDESGRLTSGAIAGTEWRPVPAS